MIKNYLRTAWRNLLKNKTHSFINISGLSVGMAVAMIIGLWIWDEISYNKSFQQYDRIAQIMQNQTFDGVVTTQQAVPYLLGEELTKNYGSDFKNVTMASWTTRHVLSSGEKKLSKLGNFFEPPITEMLSLDMVKGSRDGLRDMHAILLSASMAKALFGDADPMNKIVTIDNNYVVKVTGVYKDLPNNSDFSELAFIAPWKLFIDGQNWSEKLTNPWRSNAYQTYVQLADHADMNSLSAKIRDVKLHRVTQLDAAFKPVIFLLPMEKWHLYSQFKDGVNVGGRIQFVWLFGIIGVFVLLLACINFMNLSTARSEKRAKEVGIRKAIGSLRSQLITQFFFESVLVSILAFVLSLILADLALPFFNQVADKKISFPRDHPLFWVTGICFSLVTGLVAGSYPALYLSSFQPVKVLKGVFRVGRFASVPRKVLVVLQFSVSIMLIIGTIIVFRQIQFAKNRPIGYSRDGQIVVQMATADIHKHLEAVRTELIQSGAVAEMAESSSSTTMINEVDNGFEWSGKPTAVSGNFAVCFTSPEFGKTIGWQFKDGRDFSRAFATDSTAMIINETAATFMGLKHPVGETIKWDGQSFHIIGVVKDLLMGSPYAPVYRTVFVRTTEATDYVNIRINPSVSASFALQKIEAVFKKYNPADSFEYTFINDEYAKKFSDEERIGKLAGGFAGLAIFVSCLGLFGMASFMAEQRTKEIGVRKLLGASVFTLWKLLSKDFIFLVIVSLLIASPVAWFFMNSWLQHYDYRADITWWIFAAAGSGAMLITLLTVSYQAIRAAIANPVKSLKSE